MSEEQTRDAPQPMSRLQRNAAGGGSPPATPSWVKAFGIAAVILILVFVALHLTGNSPMHTPSSEGIQHAARLL